MTTIAYRNGTLVADTAVFDRGCYCGEATKIFQMEDGTMFGVAGALGDLARFRDWMIGGEPAEGKPEFDPQNDSEAIVVRPDGTVQWWGSADQGVAITGEFYAIGSGFRIAMGAMAAGASAADAVGICADLDNMTRRPLITLVRPEGAK